jgi:hypothetical protein
MRIKPLLVITLFVSACAAMPFPGMGGGAQSQTQAQKTETHSSSQTEEMHVNGHPVSVAQRDADEEEAPRAPKKSKKDKGDFGKTCHKNNECSADACFVGAGELGYCTKFCNSFSDCPSFWECKKPGNAPQRICMQDND